MPRRALLFDTERDSLLALPEIHVSLIQHYSFTDTDIASIRQRRGDANRLALPSNWACYAIWAMR
jgi:hypothetical protein